MPGESPFGNLAPGVIRQVLDTPPSKRCGRRRRLASSGDPRGHPCINPRRCSCRNSPGRCMREARVLRESPGACKPDRHTGHSGVRSELKLARRACRFVIVRAARAARVASRAQSMNSARSRRNSPGARRSQGHLSNHGRPFASAADGAASGITRATAQATEHELRHGTGLVSGAGEQTTSARASSGSFRAPSRLRPCGRCSVSRRQ